MPLERVERDGQRDGAGDAVQRQLAGDFARCCRRSSRRPSMSKLASGNFAESKKVGSRIFFVPVGVAKVERRDRDAHRQSRACSSRPRRSSAFRSLPRKGADRIRKPAWLTWKATRVCTGSSSNCSSFAAAGDWRQQASAQEQRRNGRSWRPAGDGHPLILATAAEPQVVAVATHRCQYGARGAFPWGRTHAHLASARVRVVPAWAAVGPGAAGDAAVSPGRRCRRASFERYHRARARSRGLPVDIHPRWPGPL